MTSGKLPAAALWAVLSAALLAAPTIAPARDLVVQQMGRANVFGSVQASQQSGSLNIEQTGDFNVAGVVQAVPNGSVRLFQTGPTNTALVGQFTPAVPRLLP